MLVWSRTVGFGKEELERHWTGEVTSEGTAHSSKRPDSRHQGWTSKQVHLIIVRRCDIRRAQTLSLAESTTVPKVHPNIG